MEILNCIIVVLGFAFCKYCFCYNGVNRDVNLNMKVYGEIERYCALPVGGLLNYERLLTFAEQFDYYYWSRAPVSYFCD